MVQTTHSMVRMRWTKKVPCWKEDNTSYQGAGHRGIPSPTPYPPKKSRNTICVMVCANVLAVGIITVILLLHRGESQQQDEICHSDQQGRPVVRTLKGALRGIEEKSINGHHFYSFYSIPYAKPPVEELRFQGPVEPESWERVRDASRQPEPCVQYSFKSAKAGSITEDDVIGTEDCLYLNVFTPQECAGKRLPVMVYLHGGGYVGGSAQEFEPYVLLDHEVVLVVVQFRLGALAFLSTEDEVMPGNNMLKDQVAALEWVQRNIWIFGGDPRRVMMFGESSGGCTSSLLALSPKAQGLFSRTVWHSGSALTPFAVSSQHRQVAEKTATSMGHSGSLDSRSIRSFLQTVSAKSLAFSNFLFYEWFVIPTVMAPRIDGDIIPEEPYKMALKMACPSWELMTGSTAHDGGLLTLPFYQREGMRTSLEEDFVKIGPLSLLLKNYRDPNSVQQATALYRYYLGEDMNFDLTEEYTQLITDHLFGVPSDLLALTHSTCVEPQNKTFSFVFSYRGERSASDKMNVTVGKEWVTHLDDLLYLFPVNALLGGAEPLSSPEDLAVREIMTKLWVNFASTGNPTPDSSLGFTWEPVQTNDLKNLKLTLSPSMEADPRSKTREFYRTVLPEQNALLSKLEEVHECKTYRYLNDGLY